MKNRRQRCLAAPRWKSPFARFVQLFGVVHLATEIEVTPSAIYNWISGAAAPRRAHAAIIQRLARDSGVKLTLEQIYQHPRDLLAGGRDWWGPGFTEGRFRENAGLHASAK
jgi:hypothetical protein